MNIIKLARVPAITALPCISVHEAVTTMTENDVGALVLINDRGAAVGIFTERDNLRRISVKGIEESKTPVSEVMSSPVITVGPETNVDDALRLMIQHRFRHLPVVDNNEIVIGMVSLRYLLMRQIGQKQATVETLAAYIEAGGPG